MKVFGIGLNKTGTKTLGTYLQAFGFRHRSYDSDNTRTSPSYDLYQAGQVDRLLDIMEDYDSCEDWPWPLLYQQLDERFPDARFVLTVRASADVWYRSLCNMAVRLGPFPLWERLVYGHAMPQGHRQQHVEIYQTHNARVSEYFRDRPGKLLTVCWERGDDVAALARFLDLPVPALPAVHENRSPSRVYSGENRWRAELSRVGYQRLWGPWATPRRVARTVKRRLGG